MSLPHRPSKVALAAVALTIALLLAGIPTPLDAQLTISVNVGGGEGSSSASTPGSSPTTTDAVSSSSSALTTSSAGGVSSSSSQPDSTTVITTAPTTSSPFVDTTPQSTVSDVPTTSDDDNDGDDEDDDEDDGVSGGLHYNVEFSLEISGIISSNLRALRNVIADLIASAPRGHVSVSSESEGRGRGRIGEVLGAEFDFRIFATSRADADAIYDEVEALLDDLQAIEEAIADRLNAAVQISASGDVDLRFVRGNGSRDDHEVTTAAATSSSTTGGSGDSTAPSLGTVHSLSTSSDPISTTEEATSADDNSLGFRFSLEVRGVANSNFDLQRFRDILERFLGTSRIRVSARSNGRGGGRNRRNAEASIVVDVSVSASTQAEFDDSMAEAQVLVEHTSMISAEVKSAFGGDASVSSSGSIEVNGSGSSASGSADSAVSAGVVVGSIVGALCIVAAVVLVALGVRRRAAQQEPASRIIANGDVTTNQEIRIFRQHQPEDGVASV